MCLAIIGNEDVLFSQLNPIEMKKQQHVFSDQGIRSISADD